MRILGDVGDGRRDVVVAGARIADHPTIASLFLSDSDYHEMYL
jgi:hypothetical protein